MELPNVIFILSDGQVIMTQQNNLFTYQGEIDNWKTPLGFDALVKRNFASIRK